MLQTLQSVEIVDSKESKSQPATLRIPNRFSANPSNVSYELRTALILDSKGNVIFKQDNVEVPSFWSQAATNIVAQKYFRGHEGQGRESSVKQLTNRVVDAITKWGLEQGYFDKQNAEIFNKELKHIVIHQYASFNSPVWFNVGAEPHPQTAACFINSVEDSMESILELAKTEGKLFRFGSGSGTNLSTLRSSKEKLSGGGHASGPVSFMKGYDAFAGVIKSGGKTRRSSIMRILNADHPDILEFVNCKLLEEKKAKALISAGYDSNIDGDAYSTVAFQNGNNTVRVSDSFMQAVEADADWHLKAVTDGSVISMVKARELFNVIASAAHACGDPGIQFDTTINSWNTTPESGRLNATNPCICAFTPLLTPEGIRPCSDIKEGSIIWSGRQWTKVTKKWSTGIKPVYKYYTRAGIFIGTENHNIISCGERIEVQHAQTIDVATAECAYAREPIDPRDVLDGLMIGNGDFVHYAGKNHPVLNVGVDDACYFTSEIKSFISVHPFNIKMEEEATKHWVQGTSVLPTEVGSHARQVIPRRCLRGSRAKIRGFLRGFYSAKGSVLESRVTLHTASLFVVEAVQQMLSAIGIRSYYTVNKPICIKLGNGTYTRSRSYDLNITADKRLFADLIGFIHPEKTARLEAACRMPLQPVHKTSYEITEIEYLGDLPVWDISVEAAEHTYWTGGLLVSNCSEVIFLDDTACNLSSINLLKFQTEDGQILVDDLAHVVRTMVIAQDILIDKSYYPTEKITENSRRFRPLGLGYTNLGAMLMNRCLPYDSGAGRLFAAAMTAFIHGHAMAASAEMAEHLGSFEAYKQNRVAMSGVLRRHKKAALDIDFDFVPYDLMLGCKQVYQNLEANTHGFRNAQFTALAPTGTISFIMDAVTSGIEPEYALVKYKALAGGGTIKMVNGAVESSLRRLGYSDQQISEIIDHINATDTIEGAPQLKADHLPIFDCASTPANGSRSISYQGHIKMMAAVQPFISGGISKTVNLPNEISVREIEQTYLEAWKLGLKAVAIYRNGSKQAQPLTIKQDQVKPQRLARRKMSDERESITHKFNIAGHEGYITVGLYADGAPGEIFISMSKEGSTINGLMDSFATAISIALQHGVPMEVFESKFVGTNFEPSGYTQSPDVEYAKSIMDYIFKWLPVKFGRLGAPQVEPEPVRPKNGAGKASDAPLCHDCGSMMIRSGSCHKCPNCGSTSGCS